MIVKHWMKPNPPNHDLTQTMATTMRQMRHGGFDHLPLFEPPQLNELRQNAHLEPMLREAAPHALLTLDEETQLEDVARLMLRCQIGGFMVTDNAGEVVGVITAHNVLRALFGKDTPQEEAIRV